MAEAKKSTKTTKKVATAKVAKKVPAKETSAPVAPEPVMVEAATEAAEKAAVTKAGKHSAKALKEAEAEAARQARKADQAESATSEAPKTTQKPPRNRSERRGKKYREAAKAIDHEKLYTLEEALPLVIASTTVKFDASVELHINLAVDPRQADQNIRGNVALPAGTGKKVRIAVLCDVADIDKAQKSGADKVGEEAIFNELDKGVIDFDILIATPAMMPKLGKYARVLGPKGLMPNPKSGTVTPDVGRAVSEAKAGRVEYRVDSTGIVHLAVGKVSFGPAKLNENITAVMGAIKAAKPASLKGTVFVKSVHLATTMGPSVKVSAS